MSDTTTEKRVQHFRPARSYMTFLGPMHEEATIQEIITFPAYPGRRVETELRQRGFKTWRDDTRYLGPLLPVPLLPSPS